MGADDFKGLTLTPKTLTYIAGLLALGVFLYNGVQNYSRMQFDIERLAERDASAASDISRLSAKLDTQTNTITELKIAVNRLADQLERSRNDQ